MKTCSKCKETKPLTDFFKDKRLVSGYRADCKLCKRASQLKYTSSSLGRLAKNQAQRKYVKSDRGRVLNNAKSAKRRASKLSSTPTWYEKEEIKQFYINCPEGHQVDHIVPLQGKNVRGLHVLANLQYLTVEENLRKSNKF